MFLKAPKLEALGIILKHFSVSSGKCDFVWQLYEHHCCLRSERGRMFDYFGILFPTSFPSALQDRFCPMFSDLGIPFGSHFGALFPTFALPFPINFPGPASGPKVPS